MDSIESEIRLVVIVHVRATREVLLSLGVDVPREQARRDRDLVLERLDLINVGRESQKRRVHGVRVVVLEIEAILDLLRVLEELAVTPRAVAVGHDVLHHEHILRLGNDRLEVASVVT